MRWMLSLPRGRRLRGIGWTVPRARGERAAIRSFLVCRETAVVARTKASQLIRALLLTAPEPLRGQLRGHNTNNLLAACVRRGSATTHTLLLRFERVTCKVNLLGGMHQDSTPRFFPPRRTFPPPNRLNPPPLLHDPG